ncbi:MAG: S8 family serine peptidase [Acidobacteria bacterium]|nr:S8 family serine peptidase [Acidobacteriota bacterium]
MATQTISESRKVFIRVRAENPLMALEKIRGADFGTMTMAPTQPGIFIADVTDEDLRHLRERDHVEVYEDYQFHLFDDTETWKFDQPAPMMGEVPWSGKTQADVLTAINAPAAWTKTRGQNVTIVIVDTGVATQEGVHPSTLSISPTFNTAWEDAVGHGSMCAAIAAGSTDQGARYDGVAPDATILSARSTLLASDLYTIYTYLLTKYLGGSFPGGVVVSNSFGHYTCNAPTFPQGHPYVDLVRTCVQNGMLFVYAAGNNHATGLCNHPPATDAPNTIWATNSIDEVISVGTVNWNGSNQEPGAHANSSRGPGQWSTRRDKPDVVAPTYGEVRWGSGYQVMEWWGTSGAAPQVAGLAALLLSIDSTLTPARIMQIIKSTARWTGGSSSCVGTGMIDCAAALAAI